MDLKEYLERTHKIKKGFAKEIGINQSTLHNIMSGRNRPSAKVAQKIVELTNGEVTYDDLFAEKKKEK